MPPERRIGWATLLVYGLPGLPFAAMQLPLYINLPAFYAEDLGLGLAAVGAILLIVRTADVVTDPLLGHLSDRGMGRLGRRKAFIALGLPGLMAATWFLFVPPDDPSPSYLLFWALAGTLAATAMQLPYQAWGAELSRDYHERTAVSASREGFVVVGTLLAVIVPALVAGPTAQGLEVLAILLAVLLPLSVAWLLLRVPEPQHEKAPVPLPRGGLRLLAGNRPFRQLVCAYFVNGLANGLPATLFVLFVRHVLEVEEDGWIGLFLVLYLGTGVLSLPLWLLCSRRLGKHATWRWSMLGACAAFLCAAALGPGDLIWFAAICVATGVFLGADLALPPSIQADVIDLDHLQSGESRAGLFFALWSMATKLALALAVGLAFPLLDWAGLGAAPAGQAALIALYAVVPVALKIVAVAVMRGFDLNAEVQARLREQIARQQRVEE